MKLYDYWRSSASYRVRIALAMKGLRAEQISVALADGAQHGPEFRALNPAAAAPVLVLEDGAALTQSLAIIDYLDAIAPEPPLAPADPVAGAKVRAAALLIACDIHPINNLRIGQRLKAAHGFSQDDVVAWMRHWMRDGLTAFQAMLPADGPFAHGDRPYLSDVCLIPQLYNAHRWGMDFSGLERLLEIEQRCLALPAFAAARPEAQPDATPRDA